MSNPAHTYRQFSVQGATPLGLVVMLYDGAIAALEKAAQAMQARDIGEKCARINRALAIIAQLEGTLNFELGGEVAKTLKCLYVYARAQIIKANIENSPDLLRSVIEKLATVREAWYQADHAQPADASASREGASSPPASGPPPGSWRISA